MLLALVAVVFCVMAQSAHAAVLRAGNTYELAPDTMLEGDAYLAGRSVSMQGSTTGDIYAAGSSVEVLGAVAQDVLLLGGTVLVTGPIAGDARLVGGEVYLNATVTEDAVLVGGTVEIRPDTVVEGDLIVFADRFVLAGTVKGNVEVYARTIEVTGLVEGAARFTVRESLAVKSGAFIQGDIVYKAPRQAFITDDASIGGAIDFEQQEMSGPTTKESSALGYVLRALIGFVAAAVLMFVAPRYRSYMLTTAFTRSATVLVWGFVALILVPVCGIVLFFTILGMLPGILVLSGYVVALVVAKAAAPILAGALLARWLKKDSDHIYSWTALGAAVLSLLSLVPLLGWVATSLLLVLAFGTVVVGLYEHVWPMRALPPAEKNDTHEKENSTEKSKDEGGSTTEVSS